MAETEESNLAMKQNSGTLPENFKTILLLVNLLNVKQRFEEDASADRELNNTESSFLDALADCDIKLRFFKLNVK